MTKPRYGGQAVIEGVMMAGPQGKAIAVRTEDGNIVRKIDETPSFTQRHPAFKAPFLRGIVSFAASLVSGMKDLTWSAAQAGETEDEKLSTGSIIGAVVVAAIIAIVIFIALPVFAATWLHPYVGDFGRSLIEGLLRAGLFIGYIALISRMEDIRRLFAYHGAEHKTINAFEAGAELTPESVANYSRIHTRCGTSFIMMALIVMIIIFTFIGQTTAIYRILIKIVLLPVVAGLSYELFRLPLKFPNSKIVRALVAPGLALQHLTTREPELDQLEVAITALTSVPHFNEDAEAGQIPAETAAPGKAEAEAQPAPAASKAPLTDSDAMTAAVTEETIILERSSLATAAFDTIVNEIVGKAEAGEKSAAEEDTTEKEIVEEAEAEEEAVAEEIAEVAESEEEAVEEEVTEEAEAEEEAVEEEVAEEAEAEEEAVEKETAEETEEEKQE